MNNYQNKLNQYKRLKNGENLGFIHNFFEAISVFIALVFIVLFIVIVGLVVVHFFVGIVQYILYGELLMLKEFYSFCIEFKDVFLRACLVSSIMGLIAYITYLRNEHLNKKIKILEQEFLDFWNKRIEDGALAKAIRDFNVVNSIFVHGTKINSKNIEPVYTLMYVFKEPVLEEKILYVGRQIKGYLSFEDGVECFNPEKITAICKDDVVNYMNCDVDKMKLWNEICDNQGSDKCKLQIN